VGRNLVEALRPISQDLGCEAQLEGVLEIVEGGNGADKQRAVLLEDGSLQEVAAYLAAATV
jgi:carboxylate-amine ligase